MLLSSTGGLLFVFNRNLSFLLFSLFIICSFFLISKGLKSKNFYSSLLAFCTVIVLFIINFFIAEVQPQSLTKLKTFKYLLYYIDISEKPEAQVTLFGINLVRNSSIFWEPGILQFYLNLLFFLEISFFKRKNYIIILTVLAILSTYSTTGLLLLMVQIVYFLNRQFDKKFSGILIFIIAVLLK